MTSLLQLFDHSSFSQPGRDQRSAVSISCRSASHAAGIWPAAGSGTRWWPQCFPVHVRISCQHGDCISSGFFSFFALRPTATHSTCRWPCETLRPYQAALLPTHTGLPLLTQPAGGHARHCGLPGRPPPHTHTGLPLPLSWRVRPTSRPANVFSLSHSACLPNAVHRATATSEASTAQATCWQGRCTACRSVEPMRMPSYRPSRWVR